MERNGVYCKCVREGVWFWVTVLSVGTTKVIYISFFNRIKDVWNWE